MIRGVPVRSGSPGEGPGETSNVRASSRKFFEAFGVIIRQQEGLEVVVELGGCLIMIQLDGGFFQGPVHPLDLAVGPRVGHERTAMFKLL